ncbi:MAG: hypothetical protein ACLQF2_16085 [Rhodomicrobium sp.]
MRGVKNGTQDRNPIEKSQKQLARSPLRENRGDVGPSSAIQGKACDAAGAAIVREHVDKAADRARHGDENQEIERGSWAGIAGAGLRQKSWPIQHRRPPSRH